MAIATSRFLIGLACLVVTALAGGPAWAQPQGRNEAGGSGGGFGGGFGGMMGLGQMGGARITRQQLEDYAQMLGLDATQREVAQLLLDEYVAGVQQAMDELREAARLAREAFQETRDGSAFESMRTQAEKTRQRVAELESAFLADLKALLGPEQESAWPRVERAHRRATSLPRGLMSGERVDLFAIVQGLDLDEQAAASAGQVLAEYELALDEALKARDAMYEQGLEMLRAGDFESLQAHFDRARQASMKVRDTHRAFARRLEAILPAEQVQAMQQAVRRASYPMVYRPTRLDRAAEAVASMEGLSADQRSQVEAVVLAAQRRLETIHRQMVEQIDRSEAQMTLRDMMRTGGRGNDDVRRLMDDRRQAIEQAIGQIRQVLGEELAQKLEEAIGPQRDEAAPRDGRPGRGGRLGNERPQRRGGEL